jgi:ABC-2 type transport system permease protein
MIVFTHTLRRYARPMLYWGVFLAFFAALQVAFIQDVEALQQLSQLYETLPSFLLQGLVGSSDLAVLATPNGYLASRFFGFGLVWFGIYALVAGMNVTANDEDSGVLDTYISLPLPRWRLVLERLAAYAVTCLGVVALTTIGLMSSALLVPDIGYDLGFMVLSSINLLPGTLVILAVTAALGALVRRRSTALGIAGLFLAGSYMVHFLADSAPTSPIAALRPLSVFSYIEALEVVSRGLNLVNLGLLLIAALVVTGIGVVAFQRRDIGV